MTDHASDRAAQYNTLASSFALGLFRLMEARIVSLTVTVALYRLNSAEEHPASSPGEALKELRSVSYNEFDSFRYVTDASLLVYGMTLLDTFLTDTTRFLLLLHPESIGENQAVPLKSLLAASSRAELITEAAVRRAREISYLPFLGRIQFLRKRFGLEVSLDDRTLDDLEHYSEMRNVVVHDQAVFDVRIGESGAVEVLKKSCPRHPTPLGSHDLAKALRACRTVVGAIYTDVVTRVLRSEPDGRFLSAVSAFDRSLAKSIAQGDDSTAERKSASEQ